MKEQQKCELKKDLSFDFFRRYTSTLAGTNCLENL